jgi:hypothetical protein
MNDDIWVRCDVLHAAAVRSAGRCAICEDEREAVYWTARGVILHFLTSFPPVSPHLVRTQDPRRICATS